MKKIITIALTFLSLVSCTNLDEVWEELRDHEERIQKLEALCNKLNSNIEAVQTILAALQQNDYVTDIVKVVEDGVEVGYSITFAKGGTVTIYHGADGADGTNGDTPDIGIKKASDGAYYWTSDGEWLTDDEGNMIHATVSDPDGGYVTPQFRVNDGIWYVSLDNGNTWRLCDIHDNTANEQIFSNIEVLDGYIVLTIADGTRLKILTVNDLEDSQTLINKLNVNISSLQTIVRAIKMSDYITSVMPLTERSMLIGYIINFAQTKSVTIYYNPDEKDLYDRYLPVVGVRKMSDGIYYWTVNGNLYLRENGSKVPVLSNNDSAPILKISDGFWYISFDDGTTWRQVPITDNDGETNVKVAYSLVHGNRYSSGHLTEQTRASIVPYTVIVPAGVTIRPKDGYVWGWYTNVNTVDPANSNLASGGWVTSTYTGNGSAIGVTVKKTNDSVIDFSIDGYSPGDYLIASDPSIWYFDDDSAVIQVNQIFSSVDMSNANYLTLTLADGTVIKIHTLKGIEEKESNYWSDKSFACIGDSITEGAGTTKTYWEFLDETLSPLSMTAMGVSGSCVSAMSDYGTRNSPLINRYTSIPDADVITIYMGTNDYGHETPLGTIDDKGDISFYGALNTIIPGIIAAHPSSRLIWITPTHRYGRGTSGILGTTFTYDYIPNGRGHCLKDYVDAIKAVCERHSIPVIDLFNISGMDPSISEVRSAYMPDGLHPNEAGHKKIAAIIAASLESLRWSIGTEPEDDTNTTYSYVPLTPGILSPNDSYRRVSLFAQDGQDGTIYKGLSFRGDGNGKVIIKDIEACSTVATMKWDKADKIKPHDNSLTKRFDFGKDIPINISWTLNSTYRTATGLLESGSRAVSPKLCLPFYSDINLTISSCTFIVSCYDSNDTYLGQITPSLDGLSKSTTQWLTAGTRITGDIIKAISPNIHHISLVANKNEYPTYNATYTGETYHIYSNVYNTYSSQEDKHIGECCVYSVSGDGKIWSNNLQQLLKIGFISDSTLWPVASETRPYGNFVVDNENQYLYVFVMYSSKSLTYWYKFALPSVNDGEWSDTYGCKVKVLNEEDILDSWTTTHQNYIQGACVYDGLIWSTEGFTATSGTNVARMRVIDPHKKSEIAVFNFFSDGDPIEPEFVDFYNDRCYYGSVKQMYILDLL